MELFTQTSPAVTERNVHTGTERFTVAAGKDLKIETSPQGEGILSVTVPIGKLWDVSISISITETSV